MLYSKKLKGHKKCSAKSLLDEDSKNKTAMKI